MLTYCSSGRQLTMSVVSNSWSLLLCFTFCLLRCLLLRGLFLMLSLSPSFSPPLPASFSSPQPSLPSPLCIVHLWAHTHFVGSYMPFAVLVVLGMLEFFSMILCPCVALAVDCGWNVCSHNAYLESLDSSRRAWQHSTSVDVNVLVCGGSIVASVAFTGVASVEYGASRWGIGGNTFLWCAEGHIRSLCALWGVAWLVGNLF